MDQKPSFLMPTLINSIIVALITTVLSTVILYVSISGEPSGSFFNATSLIGIVACLVSALAGVLSVRSYAKTDGVDEVKIGDGVKIGLVAGIFITVISLLISILWNTVIDPDMMARFAEYSIENMEMALENAGQSGVQLDETLGAMEESFQEASSIGGMIKNGLIGGIGYIIINLISGAITGKVMSKD